MCRGQEYKRLLEVQLPVLRAVKISENIYLVGSGEVGLSNRLDCHVYLVGGLAMTEAGARVVSERLLANVNKEGTSSRVSQ